jgi:hypothetical protein
MNKSKIIPTKIVEIEISKWDQTRECVLLGDKIVKIRRIKGKPVDPDPYYHMIINDDFEFGHGEDQLSDDQIVTHCLVLTGGRIPIELKQSRVIPIPHDIGLDIVEKGPDYLDVLEKIGNGDIKVGIEIEHRMKNPKNGKPLVVNFDPKTGEVKCL